MPLAPQSFELFARVGMQCCDALWQILRRSVAAHRGSLFAAKFTFLHPPGRRAILSCDVADIKSGILLHSSNVKRDNWSG